MPERPNHDGEGLLPLPGAETAAAPAGLAVQLAGVDKTFPDGLEVLRGVDLAIAPGQFVSLLGPSGCGKTTLLRLVAGLEAPTDGTVMVGQGEADRISIGYVFQFPTLMPWASVAENVRLPLRMRRVPGPEARRRVAEALHQVQLSDFADTLPSKLSGGMAMRVSIARALVIGPRLLLMDEPFAALDEMSRFQLGEELSALQARLGFTVLFVTHSVYEAAFLADRIAVMTPRPGAVATLVDNPAASPRADAYRMKEEYHRMVRAVQSALHDAGGSDPRGRWRRTDY